MSGSNADGEVKSGTMARVRDGLNGDGMVMEFRCQRVVWQLMGTKRQIGKMEDFCFSLLSE